MTTASLLTRRRGWLMLAAISVLTSEASHCRAADAVTTATNSEGPQFGITVYIAKPASEVWAALLTKDIVDKYHLVPLLKLEPKVGGRIAYGRDTALIEGVIKQFEPQKSLVHTFHFVGSKDPETTVIFDLAPEGDAMCRLRIVHIGFKEENQTFEDTVGGWPMIASSLKTLLETGKTLPWPKS
jgi:uncharacterized protein YndB with AHSA1/START domain